MKTLEIRRHSIRSKPGDHLNQSGVTLARLVGQNIGPFDRVVTSTIPRAFETAIAMGFAVDEQNELMSTTGSSVEREAPWPLSFPIYAEIIKQDGPAAKYANKLAKYYAGVMDYISEGRSALVVNHGGIVEMGIVACPIAPCPLRMIHGCGWTRRRTTSPTPYHAGMDAVRQERVCALSPRPPLKQFRLPLL